MAKDLIHFLDQSLTSWHAVHELITRFKKKGFKLLKENERWKLKSGENYLVQRGGALCALVLPSKKAKRANIFATHTDSPALKLKPNPLFKTDNYTQIGVEVYGGPMIASWLNRDLHIAGRVFVKTKKGEIKEKLVHVDDKTIFIPQLAIHLDREVNEKGPALNKQTHLNAIVGLDAPLSLNKLLGISDTILTSDLFLISAEKAHYVGAKSEMIASSRLDNLLSTHALAEAFLSKKTPADTAELALFFDHEEIGSMTAEGADSPFLDEILSRLFFALGLDQEEQSIFKAESLCLSIDANHAKNPNYPDKQDPHHAPLFEKGINIKFNANHRYASNAQSAHKLIEQCQKAKIPYQLYAPRSDLPCGSTVGPVLAKRMGIPTIDLGPPLLSMHSIREVIAVKDYQDLVKLLSQSL